MASDQINPAGGHDFEFNRKPGKVQPHHQPDEILPA